MTRVVIALVAVIAAFTSSSASLIRRRSVSILPHDTYPGYGIKQFTTDQFINYRLQETGFSEFFTVLENGLVMTTSDLSPLVNMPVNLVVVEESPNRTSTHKLELYVLDRRNILNFPNETYSAQVTENAKPGTLVKDIPILVASSHRHPHQLVRYTISKGNENHTFSLMHPTTHEISNSTESKIGVLLVTRGTIDREEVASYSLCITATDIKGINKAETHVLVNVQDENDNSPVFSRKVYRFIVGDLKAALNSNISHWKKFSSIGSVSATDADGDKVAYRLAVPSNLVVIVPQTGELLLTGDPPGEDVECELTVEAHDLRSPSRFAREPAQVWLQFNSPVLQDEQILQMIDRERGQAHHIEKRRVTRAVRPTKRIDFSETDGEMEGRIVFALEKETEREKFKIRDENPWITVDENGDVRVKKRWDFEELGPEKTIDFWVTINNQATNGGKNLLILIIFLIVFTCIFFTAEQLK